MGSYEMEQQAVKIVQPISYQEYNQLLHDFVFLVHLLHDYNSNVGEAIIMENYETEPLPTVLVLLIYSLEYNHSIHEINIPVPLLHDDN